MRNRICEAIKNKKVIEFHYEGQKRIVEPHCCGVLKNTNHEALCAYQIGGYSSSGKNPPWRLYLLPGMSVVVASEKQFDNPRPGYKRNDSRMSSIYSQL
jgi:hypothetical protein